MSMILKVILLFSAILLLTPLVFFTLVAYLGKYFAFEIDKDSVLAQSKNKLVQKLFRNLSP